MEKENAADGSGCNWEALQKAKINFLTMLLAIASE
jgi:hypothetical protein